ncbi:MAG: shikimate kinase [Agathobacter sp.]|nr:shikimate kinase [Agathobacter sp.]
MINTYYTGSSPKILAANAIELTGINTYYIGGSPCSGKSTVAEIISEKYNLYYFKVDDFLEKYTKMGAAKGYEICLKQERMSAEETWMRDPLLQCNEEFTFYEEIFEFILSDLEKINHNGIITEGAAYLPKLMKNSGVLENRYIAITPSEDFQIEHYRQREWVPFVLEGCSDKDRAFSNWMKRDILFAKEVQKNCDNERFYSIINNGSVNVDELVAMVVKHFGLGE